MIKKINIAVFLMCGICLYNLFSSSGLICGFKCDNKEILKISYDVSLALFAGGLLYLFTSALPNLVKSITNKKNIAKELNNIMSFIERRFEANLSEFLSNKNELFFDDKQGLSTKCYGDKIGDEKTYFEALSEIHQRIERLKEMQILFVSIDDEKIYEQYFNILKFTHNTSFEFIQKEKEDIKDKKIGISKTIFNLYLNLSELKDSVEKKDE